MTSIYTGACDCVVSCRRLSTDGLASLLNANQRLSLSVPTAVHAKVKRWASPAPPPWSDGHRVPRGRYRYNRLASSDGVMGAVETASLQRASQRPEPVNARWRQVMERWAPFATRKSPAFTSCIHMGSGVHSTRCTYSKGRRQHCGLTLLYVRHPK